MTGILFQLSGLDIGVLFGVGLSIVSAVLGFVITYIAFQGYRRNGSRPMLFVAVGFLLVFVVPFLISIIPTLLILLGQVGPLIARLSAGAGIITEVSRVIGLVSILYGLRMPLRR